MDSSAGRSKGRPLRVVISGAMMDSCCCLRSCSLKRWLVGELENARESCGAVFGGRQMRDGCEVTGRVNWELWGRRKLERKWEGCRIKLSGAAHQPQQRFELPFIHSRSSS
jgi:hypothetical protein